MISTEIFVGNVNPIPSIQSSHTQLSFTQNCLSFDWFLHEILPNLHGVNTVNIKIYQPPQSSCSRPNPHLLVNETILNYKCLNCDEKFQIAWRFHKLPEFCLILQKKSFCPRFAELWELCNTMRILMGFSFHDAEWSTIMARRVTCPLHDWHPEAR